MIFIKETKKVIAWSGGKDSTASVILAHEKGIPIDLIIISLVWFDKSRGIYGESPEHIKWVLEYAKPLFESWGYKVAVVDSDRDYLHHFYNIRRRSKYPEMVGKYHGFVLAGKCRMNREKTIPMQRYLCGLGGAYELFVGIAADEKKRLEKMKARKNESSLLEQYGMTGADAKALCAHYGLLSPLYQYAERGGCWFCPNQTMREMAHTKTVYPELWAELARMGREPNKCSEGFRYGKSFFDVDEEVEQYLKGMRSEVDAV